MGRLSTRSVILLLVAILVIEGALMVFVPDAIRGTRRSTDGGSAVEEVRIGSFDVQLAGRFDEPIRMQAEIHVTVPASERASFQRLLEQNPFRVREAIGAAMRNTAAAELREPELGTLKRRLKQALAQVMGPPGAAVEDVIVASFVIDPF